MEIVRDYKKASKHKWWKITLGAEYDGIWTHETLKCLRFDAYGFSSKHNYKNKGIHREHSYGHEFIYYGTSKDDCISKENEMIDAYYNFILDEIESNKNYLQDRKKDFHKKDNLLKSFFEIKEFKSIQRKKKLEKIDERL